MLKFLLHLYFTRKEKFLFKFNFYLNLIWFYRHPVFHNYLAILYFIVGLHTVLYLCKISPEQFIVQLGLFPAVNGRFWYDVFPEFISNSPSKRISYFFLNDLFDVMVEENLCMHFFNVLDFYFIYYLWVI